MSIRRDINPPLVNPKAMTVRNYNPRIRTQRMMSSIENLARVVSIGVFLDGENSGLTRKDGTPIMIAALDPGANPIINDNNLNNTYPTDNVSVDIDPATVEATTLGATVSRNAFAHVGGPLVRDANGVVNYHLDLRGYNKNGTLASREKDSYAGLQLYNDGTDGLIVLSSGSETTTVVDPGGSTNTTINYEAGETMRMRVSSADTALNSRSILWERRLTDSVLGGADATWGPVFKIEP